jgi:hypothetical protein
VNIELFKLKDVKFNAKEVIDDYALNITRAIFLVENDNKKQMAKFEESRKKKLYASSGFVYNI